MIIIIEGADGVGKTTLAKKLVEKFKAKYIHLTWSRELDVRMLEYQTEALIEAYEFINKTGVPCIIDRHWISESIYGQIYRNGPKMPFFGRLVERFLQSIGGFTIVCLSTNLEEHYKRFEKLKGNRFEMYDDMKPVIKMYNDFFFGNSKESDKLNKGYLREIMAYGGAILIKDYYKYEIEIEGKDIDAFVEGIKNELNSRQGVRRF